MPIRFFDMQDDLARNSWLIADVEPNGPSDWFRHRACLERVPPDYAVPLTIHNPGPSTDITYSSPVGTLIVTAAVADVFCRFCGPDDVQCLEARIENGPVGHKVIHRLREYDCVIDDRSDPKRGRLPSPFPILDSSRIGPSPIFDAKDAIAAAIVRQDLKEALEAVGARGVRFKELKVV